VAPIKAHWAFVRDINTSKTGAVTITVVQANGDRFRTVAKNVGCKHTIMKFKIIEMLPLLLLMSVLASCGVHEQNDIYATIPKGNRLTKELMIQAEQFYEHGDNLIVLYNISKDPEAYDPHLLFFDRKLKLISACYFPSQRIDSVKKDTVYAILNEWRDKRKSSFRNDLPSKYRLKYTYEPNGAGTQISKLVDGMNIESTKFVLNVRLTNEEGISWSKSAPDTSIFSTFKKKDVLLSKLEDYTLKYQDGLIAKRYFNIYGRLMWDEMIVYDEKVWKHFYDQLWQHFENKNR
jgi:hypothetical protein